MNLTLWMRASGGTWSARNPWYHEACHMTLYYVYPIQKDFQYYRNHRSNSWVSEGALHLMPTLTATEYGEDFLYNGCIDLNTEGSSPAKCSNVLFK